MKRGEVWWAQMAPPMGPRPVALLTRDDAYDFRQRVTAAPVSTRERGIQVEVRIGADEGLTLPSVVNADSLETIPIDDLRERLGQLSERRMRAVEDAIHFALALSR
jgi:mRNA interferase MazF